MGKKANLSELNELHRLTAKYFNEALESGEELSSGTLAAINSFLKTNEITVDIVDDSPASDLTNRIQELMNTDIEKRRQA